MGQLFPKLKINHGIIFWFHSCININHECLQIRILGFLNHCELTCHPLPIKLQFHFSHTCYNLAVEWVLFHMQTNASSCVFVKQITDNLHRLYESVNKRGILKISHNILAKNKWTLLMIIWVKKWCVFLETPSRQPRVIKNRKWLWNSKCDGKQSHYLRDLEGCVRSAP